MGRGRGIEGIGQVDDSALRLVLDPRDTRGWKNRYIDRLQKTVLSAELVLSRDARVLDLGCGAGRMSHWMAARGYRVVGADLDRNLLLRAAGNGQGRNAGFVQVDACVLPFRRGAFAAVLSVGMLGQFSEPGRLELVVLELARCLAPGAGVYLIEQVGRRGSGSGLPLGEYLDAFEKAGLECVTRFPVRRGRWAGLYLIRYGLLPPVAFPAVGRVERALLWCGLKGMPGYVDYFFRFEQRR